MDFLLSFVFYWISNCGCYRSTIKFYCGGTRSLGLNPNQLWSGGDLVSADGMPGKKKGLIRNAGSR